MHLDLDQLNALEAVGRHGSVTAAARELFRSPSTISYSIKRLEEAVGATLLDRSGHHASLTPAGKALAEEARTLLAQAEHAERRVHMAARGWEPMLTIAVSDLIPLGHVLSLLRRFYVEAPDTRVRLTREVLSGGWDALSSGRADFAIGAPADGAPAVPLEIRPLAEVHFVFVVAPDHPLTETEEPITAEVLRQYRAVAASDTSRGLPTRTLRILNGQPTLSVPDQGSKCEAIRRGLGVGFLPASAIAEDLDHGRLVAPRLAFSNGDKHELCYAWRAGESGRGVAWLAEHIAAGVKAGDWKI